MRSKFNTKLKLEIPSTITRWDNPKRLKLCKTIMLSQSETSQQTKSRNFARNPDRPCKS